MDTKEGRSATHRSFRNVRIQKTIENPMDAVKINEWILEKFNEDIQLLNSIKTRNISRHVMRKHSCLKKDIIHCMRYSVVADQEGGREGDGPRT